MGKFFKKYFDPIKILVDDTINNLDFNCDEYSLYDAEQLRFVADLIEKSIKEKNPIKRWHKMASIFFSYIIGSLIGLLLAELYFRYKDKKELIHFQKECHKNFLNQMELARIIGDI